MKTPFCLTLFILLLIQPLAYAQERHEPSSDLITEGVDETSDPITQALDEYRLTGTARTIEESTAVVYPYGHAQPTLTCAPLRACVIELEAGEILMAIISGDTERWLISEAYAGPSGTTPLVVVKPTGTDLTTNLILSTDRRIYELTLDAPPAGEEEATFNQNPQASYMRRVRFYYPDAMIRTLRRREEAQALAARSALPMGEDFRLENLNFNYEMKPEKGFPFVPEQVFDDGAHTYIKLPASAKNEVAPVLFIFEGGEREVLNYAVRESGPEGQYYITDRVVRHGVFVVGLRRKNWRGKSKHREVQLTILNLSER